MIRILIADDHQITRDGLKSMIKENPNMEAVGEAVNGQQVVDFLSEKDADVVLMDINMPELDGIEATKVVTHRWPSVKVLILSMNKETKFIRSAVEAGAKGYMLKDGGLLEAATAIQAISIGGSYFSPGTEDAFTQQNEEDFTNLSRREIDVLRLLGEGKSSKEIGDELFISEHTVNHHRKNLHAKTGSSKVTELLHWARENHILE